MKPRDLFLGKEIIASRSEFKRLMLTGYLSLTCIVVAIVYAILDLIHQVYYALPSYSLLFVVALLSMIYLRKKYYRTAKVVLFIAANTVVFLAALNDPFETGVFLLFIPLAIGSCAILAFDDYVTGILLASLTTILFLLAYLGDLRPAQITRPSDDYIRISFILNYLISSLISTLIVYFLMNLNRQSERELIQKEKFTIRKNNELQKVNDELDRFVYSVSHDLRSPLSSILGLTHLAMKTTNPEELNQLLKMIQGRVHAQDHFIREIIDYSRNARTETIHEDVPLKQLVDNIIESLKYNANADRIVFTLNIADTAIITSDRIRLTIILSNLIGNAIKYHDFTKDGPYIEIGYEEHLAALYVKDNGIGIGSKDQEKIFNMFYRGSDRSTGSGLGLFITREAVAKLQGTIEVKSVYGQGSTFYIYFSSTR